MDPSLETLLSISGNAVVVVIVVEALKRTLAMTAAQVDRFGPLLAILTGIVVAEIAALALGQSGRDLARAVLVGLLSGASSMGLYSAGSPVAARITGS